MEQQWNLVSRCWPLKWLFSYKPSIFVSKLCHCISLNCKLTLKEQVPQVLRNLLFFLQIYAKFVWLTPYFQLWMWKLQILWKKSHVNTLYVMKISQKISCILHEPHIEKKKKKKRVLVKYVINTVSLQGICSQNSKVLPSLLVFVIT